MSFAPPIIPQFNGNVVAMATHGSDAGMTAEFFVEDAYQEFQSEKEGRAIYKPVNKVRMYAPGAKTDIIKHVQMNDEPNSPSHPHRFPRQWQAFLAQQEQIPDGTPLEMCRFVASHRVKELKAMNVHTAEQLANIPDNILQTLGLGAMRERDLARAYLNEDVKVAELSAALAEKAAMKADMEALKLQLADLNALMSNRRDPAGVPHAETTEAASFVTPIKRGPGRPKKDQTDDL